MLVRAFLGAVFGVVLLGCDQDPFHLAEHRVAGDYRLRRWEDDSTYYLVTPSTRGAPGGAIEGTVGLIGWTKRVILVRSKPSIGDSTWVLIDLASGDLRRSAAPPPETATVTLRPAAAAWAELK